ncbi:MAG: hypothetical protein RIR68_2755, partial [Pseudomonadota bacterium]
IASNSEKINKITDVIEKIAATVIELSKIADATQREVQRFQT